MQHMAGGEVVKHYSPQPQPPPPQQQHQVQHANPPTLPVMGQQNRKKELGTEQPRQLALPKLKDAAKPNLPNRQHGLTNADNESQRLTPNRKKAKAMEGAAPTDSLFCPVTTCPRHHRAFPRTSQLNEHYRIKHGVKKYKCTKCSRAFGLARACRQHESECGLVFICSCNHVPFRTKAARNMHSRRHGHLIPFGVTGYRAVPIEPFVDKDAGERKPKNAELTEIASIFNTINGVGGAVAMGGACINTKTTKQCAAGHPTPPNSQSSPAAFPEHLQIKLEVNNTVASFTQHYVAPQPLVRVAAAPYEEPGTRAAAAAAAAAGTSMTANAGAQTTVLGDDYDSAKTLLAMTSIPQLDACAGAGAHAAAPPPLPTAESLASQTEPLNWSLSWSGQSAETQTDAPPWWSNANDSSGGASVSGDTPAPGRVEAGCGPGPGTLIVTPSPATSAGHAAEGPESRDNSATSPLNWSFGSIAEGDLGQSPPAYIDSVGTDGGDGGGSGAAADQPHRNAPPFFTSTAATATTATTTTATVATAATSTSTSTEAEAHAALAPAGTASIAVTASPLLDLLAWSDSWQYGVACSSRLSPGGGVLTGKAAETQTHAELHAVSRPASSESSAVQTDPGMWGDFWTRHGGAGAGAGAGVGAGAGAAQPPPATDSGEESCAGSSAANVRHESVSAQTGNDLLDPSHVWKINLDIDNINDNAAGYDPDRTSDRTSRGDSPRKRMRFCQIDDSGNAPMATHLSASSQETADTTV